MALACAETPLRDRWDRPACPGGCAPVGPGLYGASVAWRLLTCDRSQQRDRRLGLLLAIAANNAYAYAYAYTLHLPYL